MEKNRRHLMDIAVKMWQEDEDFRALYAGQEFTVGSALDLFGGNISFSELIKL